MKKLINKIKSKTRAIVSVLAALAIVISSLGLNNVLVVNAAVDSSVTNAGFTVMPSTAGLPGGIQMKFGTDNFNASKSTVSSQAFIDGNSVCLYSKTTGTYNDVATLYYDNVATVGDTTLHAELKFTKIVVEAVNLRATGTDYNSNGNQFWGHDSDGWYFSGGGNDYKHITFELTLYDSDDNIYQDPCWLVVSDLDTNSQNQGLTTSSIGDAYQEAWTFDYTQCNDMYVWPDCVLIASKNNNEVTIEATKTADTTSGNASYYNAGCVLSIPNGQFGATIDVATGCGSYLHPYTTAVETPTKSETSNGVYADGAYTIGDTVSFEVDHTMGTFYKDLYSPYTSLVISDQLPEGLTYKDGTAEIWSGSTDLSSYGTFTYEDGLLSFKFNSDWLSNTSNYSGQTIAMTFDATVDSFTDATSKTLTNSAYTTVSNVKYETNTVPINVVRPAIEITKVADKTDYNYGDTVTYSIKVEQTTDGATAHNVVVSDTLPDEVELVSVSSGSGGTVTRDGANGFTVTYSELSGSDTITVKATALTDGTDIPNTASVTSDDAGSGDSTAKINIYTEPSIAIEKSSEGSVFNVGEQVNYTLKITQPVEGATAYDVSVSDPIPEGLEPVSGSATITGDGNTVSIDAHELNATIPTLAYGDTVTVKFSATVSKDLVGVEDIKNTATVVGYGKNGDEHKDDDDADISVLEPGISIVKESGAGPYNVGDNVTYEIYVTETEENSPARDVVITDTLPNGLTIVGTPVLTIDGTEKGTVTTDGQTVTANVGNLEYGQTAKLTITVTIGESLMGVPGVTNTAYVTDDDGHEDQNETTFDVLEPGVAITKEADKEVYSVGDLIKYTLKISETTENAVTKNVEVTDTLPDGLTIVDEPTISGVEGTVSVSGNSILVKIPTLKYGETATVTVYARVGASLAGNDSVTNKAYVEDEYGHGDDDEVTVEVLKPDISIKKQADNSVYNVGDTIHYTITATETVEGTKTTGVVIEDELPDGLTISGTPRMTGVDGNVTVNGNKITATIDSLSYGQTATITVDATVGHKLAGKDVTNGATITDDYNNSDDDDVTVEVRHPGLTIKKTVSDGPYNVNDVITYTLTVEDPVPDSITEDVIITDDLPDGLTATGNIKLSGVEGEASVSGNTYHVSIPKLKYGETAVVTVEAKIDPSAVGKSIDNIATTEDSYDDADRSDIVIDVLQPVLSISKDVDRTVCSVDDEVTYTIVVNQLTNGAVARNVVVTDTLPDELELISVESDMGKASKDGNSFTVNCGDMWVTDTATITVKAKAIADNEDIVNTAYANADYTDEVSDDAKIAVRRPGLNIFKDADGEQYYPGDEVTYDIKVQNLKENEEGEDNVPTAYNVVVSDELPEGLTLVDVTADNEGAVTKDGNSFTVTWPYMYYGDEYAITVTATVNDDMDNTTLTNVATVDSDTTDPIDDYADIDVIKPHLDIEKDADKTIYSVDGEVIYTIDVTQTTANLTAENVVITDTLPDEMELIDATLDGIEGDVSIDGNSFTVNAPALAFGETATVTVTAKAVAEGEEVVNVAKADADHADPVDDDVTVTVLQPELGIEKNVDTTQHFVDDTVVYNIAVSELVEDAEAYNVVVSDTLPEGLELNNVSLNGLEGEIETDGNSFTVTYEMLDSYSTAVITVEATALEAAANTTLNNVASAVADNTDEVSDDADVLIMQPEIAIEKTVDQSHASAGDVVNYKVVVSETVEGIYEEDVVITDALPDGLTLTGAVELTGTEGTVDTDGDSFKIAIPQLNYGEDAVVNFQATVGSGLEGQSIVNTAYAEGAHTGEISDDAMIDVLTPEEEASNPTSTTTSENPTGTSSNVQTGDNYIMYILLACAALLLLGGCVLVMRRRRDN